MEDIEAIRAALGKIVSYDDFFEVRRELDGMEGERLFRAIWSLAIQRSPDGSAGIDLPPVALPLIRQEVRLQG